MKDENRRLADLNRAMLDAIPNALFMVDVQSRKVISANSAATQLIGIDAQSLPGKDVAEFEPLPLDQLYWDENAGGTFRPLVDAETEYQRQDGSFVPVRKTTSLTTTKEGKTVVMLVRV